MTKPRRMRGIWGKATVITVGLMFALALFRALWVAESFPADHQEARVVGLFVGLLLDPLLFIIMMPLVGLGVWLTRQKALEGEPIEPIAPPLLKGKTAAKPTSAQGSPESAHARAGFRNDAGKHTDPEPDPKNMKAGEDRFYRQALEELRKQTIDPATFARAYADALGDAEKTKALYVRYRVDSLSMDEANLEYRLRKHRELSEKAEQNGMKPLPIGPGDIKVPEAKRSTSAALAILLGWAGAHKFYMGKPGAGAVMAIVALVGLSMAGVPTFGIVAVSIYEAISYLNMKDMDFHRVYVVGQKSWF